MTWDLAVCARVATNATFIPVFKEEKKEFVTGRLVCPSEVCFLALLSSLPRVEDVNILHQLVNFYLVVS